MASQAASDLLYEHAYCCYQNGLYEKASAIFRYLTLLQPNDVRNWLGLGSSLMLLSRHEEAESIFTVAIAKNSSDIRPYIYRAECLNKLGRNLEMKQLLKYIQDVFPNKERHEFVHDIKRLQMIT